MIRYALTLTFALGLVLTACAPAGGEAAQRGNRGPITLQDIEASMVSTNAYDLVQSLRPDWLQLRGTQTFSANQPGIIIYVNDTRYGSNVRSLSELDVRNVRRIERLDSRQATTRYGAGHLQGAILVTLR
jgi:hypothetical protein